jgi:sugar lactone lactonase YvrE
VEFEKLASGYGMTEGPRVDEHNRLYFSDARYGGVYRRNPDGRIETLLADRPHVGGMAFNEGGGLIVTGPGVSLWDERTGAVRDLFTEFNGKPISRFNDMTVDSRGNILAGSLLWDPAPGLQPVPGALYRIDPPGKATLLWEPIDINNGLGFSPDGKLLYHADSMTGVWVYDVTADGGLKDRRLFAKMPKGVPDGLAVDAEGNVLVAAPMSDEVVRFRSDGTVDRRIPVPAKLVLSLVFAGPDLCDLYVVTGEHPKSGERSGSIFRARSDIPGLPVPKARF